MIKEFGEPAVEATMEQVGQLFTANIRSNDLAFRYDTTTVAIILGDTAEKEALLAVEKLRKLVADVRMPGQRSASAFYGRDWPRPSCGLRMIRWISSRKSVNRAEQALHDALTQGAGSVSVAGAEPGVGGSSVGAASPRRSLHWHLAIKITHAISALFKWAGVAGDAQPFPIHKNPCVGESPVVIEGLSLIGHPWRGRSRRRRLRFRRRRSARHCWP